MAVTGKFSDELIQRLEITHPDTKSRWQKYENKDNCKTWNTLPVPQEMITWSGDCSNDMATGTGKLILQYVLQGK